MPIYEYVCMSCGREFEAIQKFSDEPLTSCACGEEGDVYRKISLSAFQLKGGGWFKEGYSGKSEPAGEANGSASKADGSTASKSESTTGEGSKTESKSESTSSSNGTSGNGSGGSSTGSTSTSTGSAAS